MRYSAFAVLAVMVMTLPAGSASAQNVSLGQSVYKDKIQCGQCHGWAGNGVPDDPRMAKGADLRATKLTRDQIVEVIKCGRPGTEMPHFDARAYQDDRCYGSTAAQLGDQTPHGWQTPLNPREIEAVADYLEAKVVGKGAPTKAECEDFFGAGAAACKDYQ